MFKTYNKYLKRLLLVASVISLSACTKTSPTDDFDKSPCACKTYSKSIQSS